ncbi:MAG: succinate dehydrogenase/fumarate reductase cytochrome b subunit [Proteobacteria bacterium]|jgi:fumarate reductase subunit C|nr:succinate dehydrogenase/fumarate reductase cytochrome b subunit [Pseudomonadota bacterium]
MSDIHLTHHIPRLSRAAGILDVLQMASGVFLILFLWGHMLLVGTVIVSPVIMTTIAESLEHFYLPQIGAPFVVAGFLFHALLAARKMPFRTHEQRVFRDHSWMMRHVDTTMWLVQVATAMVILALACIHMWTVLTDFPITAVKSAARVQDPFWLAFYIALLPCAELHLGIGFYRIGVKWGVVGRRGRHWFKVLEFLMLLFFVTIGATALYSFLMLPVVGG